MADSEEPKPEGYTVGYGKPPVGTRFQPGQSGNAKGRPKGIKNFGTALEEELKSRVAINENGKRKTITKREAIAKQLVNKSASGDLKATSALLSEVRLRESVSDTAPLAAPGTSRDEVTMENILKRIRQTMPADVPPEEPKRAVNPKPEEKSQ